jgi:hypothetical protein
VVYPGTPISHVNLSDKGTILGVKCRSVSALIVATNLEL